MVPGLLRYFRRFARCLYRFATTYLGLTAMLIFLRCLYRFATTHLGLTAILIFLYLLVYAQVGTSLGLPYLFWHEDAWPRLMAATGATLLLALIGVTAFWLDPYPLVTGVRTKEWLRSEEAIRTSWVRFWRGLGRPLWRALWHAWERAWIAARLSGDGGEPEPAPPTGIPPEAQPAWDAAMEAALADWKASSELANSEKAAKEAARPAWTGEARKLADAASEAAARATNQADVARQAAEKAVNRKNGLEQEVSHLAAEQAAATQAAEQAAAARAAAEQANNRAAVEQAAAEQATKRADFEAALPYAANAVVEASRFAERAAKAGEKSRAAALRAAAEATWEANYAADLAGAGLLDRAGFVINSLLFDWLVFTPAQNLVEPASEDVRRIQRFLRTCRTPFLLLLLAPAVLPGSLRQSPEVRTAMPSWNSLFAGKNAEPPGPAS